MRQLHDLVRPNIWRLAPYSSARSEYSGHEAHVFLDANENPYNTLLNRYPDPLQTEVKQRLSKYKQVPPECIFLGNGSDEAIDLVYRIFCRPQVDNVVAIEPTYGMYKVCADINDVAYKPVLLDEHYQLNADRLLAACDKHTKVVWLCSPNNPSGNNLQVTEVEKVLSRFDGIIVIDEAYSDFSTVPTFRRRLAEFPNLIVLNTMSKAWGCAAIRLGMAFADKEIIGLFNKVKYPYNVNQLTQRQALEELDNIEAVEKWVSLILLERKRMLQAFKELPVCKEVFPTDANFFLARMTDAQGIYDYLVGKGIIVRNRTHIKLCNDCLRVTIGTKTENAELLSALREMQA
ncbi:histidinol-phosphate aminotransferase [Hallella multisaccharivorax DSM 17128]|uniref:Histidinol-phosphate aminotransferase n=1 Tax=Hallella multisaccharivorax DSM 17128 TaxID=688246 RepID=F8N769_9BACT|nr:histidinol-phosphate transaminase [Hallella multisaccharivorax]EGN57385.1 histidinol phosphate aminotransferase apoenzyme [Hallella multisaccharivorax DSM 17128]GJG31376.1 histidinol-phosphate aminotransferase [Hallella multisaccharivorax DSM 17128]